MKTCEEMAAEVLRVGEARLAEHKARKKTAGALCCAALLLAAFLGAGQALLRQPTLPTDNDEQAASRTAFAENGESAATAAPRTPDPDGSEPAATAPQNEPSASAAPDDQPAPADETEPEGCQLPPTTAVPATSALPTAPPSTAALPTAPPATAAIQTAPSTAEAEIPADTESPTAAAPGTQTSPALPPTEEGTLPVPAGAACYTAEGMRRLAENNELGWIRVNGRLYVHDAWAGTWENGAPKSPDARLGATTDFENNFGLFGVSGEVYTLRGRADDAEIMVITARGDLLFLIAAGD